MEPTKTCNRCGETKPLDGFGKNRGHKDGRETICKECYNKAGRARRALARTPEEILPDGLKRCRTCHKAKPLDEFGIRSNYEDGHNTKCKACVRVQARQYRTNNREKYNAKHREYYARNRERINALSRERRAKTSKGRATYLKYAYNLTLVGYNEMLKSQGGGCAICGITPRENGRQLAVDHNHKTGKIRGLLCNNCNQALGRLQDAPRLLRNAADYLESFQ